MRGANPLHRPSPVDKEKQEWLNEYKHYEKKVRAAQTDTAKLLSFCKTTTLKNDVLRMCEEGDAFSITLLYEEDKTKNMILAIGKQVKTFKESLMSEVRNEDYYLRAEMMADKIEGKVKDIKAQGGNEYALMEEEIEQLDRNIGFIEHNLAVYERKVEVDELEGQEHIKRAPGGYSGGIYGEGGEGQIDGIAKIEVIDGLVRQRTPLGHEYRQLVDRMQEMKFNIAELNTAIEENGGLNCRWVSGKDHSEYCKLRIRHQGRTESFPFFEDCKILLPLYPEGSIREHTQAHGSFLKLDARRKEILAEYKRSKEEKKRLETVYRTELNTLQENEKKEDPEQVKIEQARKKELIERWKRERVVQREITDDKLLMDKATLDAETIERKRKEVEDKRKMVQEYREKKEIEKIREFERTVAQEAMKRHVSSDQRQRVMLKEQELIEKKRHTVLLKRAEEEERKIKKELELIERNKK